MSTYDLVIQGATVFDGTGARRAPGRRRACAAIGSRRWPTRSSPPARRALDARGLALAPGFLDVHTHDDFAVVLHPEMGFKVQGGVTSVVVGNCGMGAAPLAQARGYAAAFHPGIAAARVGGLRGLSRSSRRRAGELQRRRAGRSRRRARGGDGRRSARAERRRAGSHARAGARGRRRRLRRPLDGTDLRAGQARADRRDRRARRRVRRRPAVSTRRTCATRARACSTRCASRSRSASAPACRCRSRTTRRAVARTGAACASRCELIDAARARGLDVTADQYPYTAASTVLAAVLSYSRRTAAAIGRGRRRGHPALVGAEASRVGGQHDRRARGGVGRRRRSTPRAACSTPRASPRPSCCT